MSDDYETLIERYLGDADIERLDGTTLQNMRVYRVEKYADENSLDSVYEREYIARAKEVDCEEIYLGSSKGDNLIIKERI